MTTAKPPNPHMIELLTMSGDTPEIATIRTQLWELAQRVDDLAAFVAAHVPTEPIEDTPPPVADVLAVHFGECDHGRLLRDSCPDCQRRTP